MNEHTVGNPGTDVSLDDRALHAHVTARQLAHKIRRATREQQHRADALIHRQMIMLPTQAERWRASATNFMVDAALSSIPAVQSTMFRIAEQYTSLAQAAEERYAAYVKKCSLTDFSSFIKVLNLEIEDALELAEDWRPFSRTELASTSVCLDAGEITVPKDLRAPT